MGFFVREWNLLRSYPQSEKKVGERTIRDRIIASYRGRDFYDGPRSCGYGGYKDDRRWLPVAKDIIADYAPLKRVIQFNCDKGYLVAELQHLEIDAVGVEHSSYARAHAAEDLKAQLLPRFQPEEIPNPFDLAIAIGLVYTYSLPDAMGFIRQLERIAHKAFITLATYETKRDYWLFKEWSLLGTTILKREEWLEVLNHCGYTGDYWFVDAEYLCLKS